MMSESTSSERPERLIEIGIVVAGPLDTIDQRAAVSAIDETKRFLADAFGEFQFRLSFVRRAELATDGRAEPSVLLQQAAEDRDAKHWDFVFVVTGAELLGNYSPYCFAALSRPLDAAVFSLSLIDPHAMDDQADDQKRIQDIARRLSRLMLHGLAHLTGLPPSDRANELLFHPATASELDHMKEFNQQQVDRQRTALIEVADQRLEEQSRVKTRSAIFTAKAAWINRREIAEALWGARPWEFPRRLSGLTIASVSTVVILLMTAEAWDLGLSQSPASVAILAVVCSIVTTIYVVKRQQLLLRRGRQLSEQTVVTSAAALLIVWVGMIVSWLALSGFGLVLGWLLFPPELIASWASTSQLVSAQLGIATVVHMSCFAASLGLLIGALGASFESQNYFRHIIFVDEEI